MPAEFQQTIDKTLANIPEACAFIDDIIICTKGSPAELMRAVNRVLGRLNAANLALKLSKCEFLLSEVDWFGFRLNQTGIVPLGHKLDGLFNLKRPTTFKQVRELMGVHISLPNLFQISPLFGIRFVLCIRNGNDFSGLRNTLTLFKNFKRHSFLSVKMHTTPRGLPLVSLVTPATMVWTQFSNKNYPGGRCLLRTRRGF